MSTRTLETRWTPHRALAPERAGELARSLGVPRVIGQLLLNRGLTDEESARRFLSPSAADLHDPSGLLGMHAAVERLTRALDRRERILIHGDYDVDGVTATYLLVSVLRSLGGDVHHHIPHRTREGYGLSRLGVEAAARAGMAVIVTVDCGITALEPIARARELGVDVVVTDHHEPGERLPEGAAVINPRQTGCRYPFKSLCGVAVAFKLAQALLAARGRPVEAEAYLDVVALGTIADAVPLSGENRVLAQLGLDRLSRTENLGLRELIDLAGLAERRISAGHVAFQIAPRMNAAGRMGSAIQALRLLLARDREEARACAESLEEENRRRRELDGEMERQAAERVEKELGWPECASIVLWSESWHPGVLGIVASRLVERFHRPVLLVGIRGAVARGSGRSVAQFDLTRALTVCGDLLDAYGGHAYAAGLTIAPERLPQLRVRFESLARASLDLDACVPQLTLDADLSFEECDVSLLDWLERLPPHGLENPEPTFHAADVLVESVSRAGDGRHLRLWLRDGTGAKEAIAFGLGEQMLEIARARRCSFAFVPQRNEWMGETRVQLKVKGVRPR